MENFDYIQIGPIDSLKKSELNLTGHQNVGCSINPKILVIPLLGLLLLGFAVLGLLLLNLRLLGLPLLGCPVLNLLITISI